MRVTIKIYLVLVHILGLMNDINQWIAETGVMSNIDVDHTKPVRMFYNNWLQEVYHHT